MFVLVGLLASSAFAAGCGGPSNGGATSELATSTGGETAQNTPAASSSSSSSPPPATASAAGAPLVIVPMRIRPVQQQASGAPEHLIELRADGTLAADDHVLARIDGNRVMDAEGNVVLEVTPDGHLSAPGHGTGAELTADGALVAPDGRLVVNADGTIEEHRNDGAVNRAPFRFESVPANARRTAVVVVAILSMAVASAEQAQAAASASAAPEASAPPATAAPAAAPAGRRRRGH
jgi:hypothetical protein